jgi:hypothetical protein
MFSSSTVYRSAPRATARVRSSLWIENSSCGGGAQPHIAVDQGNTGGPPGAERRPKAVPGGAADSSDSGGDAVNTSLS